MGCFRCLSVCGIISALLIAITVQWGRNHIFFAGMAPILTNHFRITEKTVPNLEEKVIIVTGANTGLGKSTSKHLYNNGATVIMTCRTLVKCDKAINDIKAERKSVKPKNNNPTGKLIPMILELGSFESIKAFSDKILSTYNRIDSLILNAGLAYTGFGLTTDGIEQIIGVNHFGHFYLTNLLLPLLEAAEPSTIVVVSSAFHHLSHEDGVKLSLEELNNDVRGDTEPYAQSKLANILFAQELSERMQEKGKKVYVNSVHPGGVNTEIIRHTVWLKVLGNIFLNAFPNVIAFESDYAALVEVYAAVSPDIFNEEIQGKYIIPFGQIMATHDQTNNRTLQKELWRFSEQVVNMKT